MPPTHLVSIVALALVASLVEGQAAIYGQSTARWRRLSEYIKVPRLDSLLTNTRAGPDQQLVSAGQFALLSTHRAGAVFSSIRSVAPVSSAKSTSVVVTTPAAPTTVTTATTAAASPTSSASAGNCPANVPAAGSGTLKFTGVNIAGAQACLATGAYCIIDMHNYARWENTIIGQPGGPTDAQFAATWSQIAAYYANETRIMFGVMNEPHNMPNITQWAGSVQAAVTAIRKAGATTQIILLPGDNWTSAQTFVSNGSADALNKVVNPDGSITNLIFDVHKYLDYDNSGTNAACVTNNIQTAWAPLAQWLRCHGRQAFNTETGGGFNDPGCLTYMCQQIAFQAQNSDVFLGYVGWAAGNFYSGYVLSEMPNVSGTTWTDLPLVSKCMAPVSGSQKGSTGL
ncbi:unnamed protein product [Mycena citricolor]|uniref:cellulase n=1 Tax=Mycena citricolor TaxID=2018698 RepID=A0AAD2HC98_9AGAR|nr:unnamed protein product [Mycena citricolor]